MRDVVSSVLIKGVCCYCDEQVDISGNGCKCKFCARCYASGNEGVICLRCGFCSECSGCGLGCGEDCGGVETLGVSTAVAPTDLSLDRRSRRRSAHDFVLVPRWEQDALVAFRGDEGVYYRCSQCRNVTRMESCSDSEPNPNVLFRGEIETELVDLPGRRCMAVVGDKEFGVKVLETLREFYYYHDWVGGDWAQDVDGGGCDWNDSRAVAFGLDSALLMIHSTDETGVNCVKSARDYNFSCMLLFRAVSDWFAAYKPNDDYRYYMSVAAYNDSAIRDKAQVIEILDWALDTGFQYVEPERMSVLEVEVA